MRVMAGVDGPVGFDVEKADLILSFGSGLLDGWGSPVRMFQAYSNRQDRKTQIVQIDSRLSNTAAKSDRWISINPGTEGTLALGLAYHIIAKSFYNKVFVDNFSAGFDSFKQKVMADFSPPILYPNWPCNSPRLTDRSPFVAGDGAALRGRFPTPWPSWL